MSISQAEVIVRSVMRYIHKKTMISRSTRMNNHDTFSDFLMLPPFDSEVFKPALEYLIDASQGFAKTCEA
jgi:hypothetical protein